jgi:acyl-CoA synthetase (AMP-forming)/AMP-acid ligase II
VTFVDYLDRGVLLDPNAVCVTGADGEDALTYGRFHALTHRVAVGARQVALGPGKKVGVLSPNTPLALAAVVGVMRSGASWVAMNPRAADEELAVLLDHVECDYLLFHESLRARSEGLMETCPRLEGAVMFGDLDADTPFERWLGPPGGTAPSLAPDPDVPVMLTGTGGTTGAPKGIAITARQMTSMALAFNAHLPEPAPPVYLVAAPMSHAAGTIAFPTLAEGGTIVMLDGVRAEAVFDAVERHRVTRLFLPPTAIYSLLAAPDVRQRDFTSLRHFVYAAAPMSVERLVEAIDVFGPVMVQVYGQSEAPMICTVLGAAEHVDALRDPGKRARLASCGRPSLVTSVEIVGDEGWPLRRGERGEIVVRGDLVMDGYYADPESAASIRRAEGWHSTGDVGYLDDDGFLYIVDRKRDMIISGGFNVFPSEIEQVVWSHEAVLDCAVIGVPDPKWGEAVTAVVELKDGEAATEEEIVELCKGRLGSLRAPKRVHFRTLPRSPAGKVLKRALRDEYWVGRERMV